MPDSLRPLDQTDLAETETINLSRPTLAAPGLKLTFAGTTHMGLVRKNNEDQYLIVRVHKALDLLGTSLSAHEFPNLPEQEGHVMLVADGIGGRSGGEQASAMVIKEATFYIMEVAKWFFRFNDPDEATRLKMLREALQRIDRRIIEAGKRDPALAGMGTTLTAATIIENDVLIVHIGDSRAYLLHSGELTQLTTDHTISQELVEQGLLSPEQAKTHKMHNVLTNALGGKLGVDADFIKLRIEPGDKLLLCTDGLSELVADERIAELLTRHSDPGDACEALQEAALNAGGIDNVTVLVAAVA